MDYQAIKIMCQKKGFTIESMAEQIGMSRTGLTASLKSGTLKIESLEKISEILGVSPCLFFQKDGISQKIDFLRDEVIGKSNVVMNIELLLKEIGKTLTFSEEFVTLLNNELGKSKLSIVEETQAYGENGEAKQIQRKIDKIIKEMVQLLPDINASLEKISLKHPNLKTLKGIINNEVYSLYKQYFIKVSNNPSIKFLREEGLITDSSILNSLSLLSFKYIGFKADEAVIDFLMELFNPKDVNDSFKQNVVDAIKPFDLKFVRLNII